jgi:hypothetical protein
MQLVGWQHWAGTQSLSVVQRVVASSAVVMDGIVGSGSGVGIVSNVGIGSGVGRVCTVGSGSGVGGVIPPPGAVVVVHPATRTRRAITVRIHRERHIRGMSSRRTFREIIFFGWLVYAG